MTDTPEAHKKPPHQPETAASSEDSHTTADESQTPENEDLGFVVTEAHDQATELIGGFKKTDVDDLGIESAADLMQQEAETGSGDCHHALVTDTGPIGDTTPPPPPLAEKPLDPAPEHSLEISPVAHQTPVSEPSLGKLSDRKVQEISKRMKGETPKEDYLTAEEKQRLLSSIGGAPTGHSGSPSKPAEPPTGFDNQPIVPPRRPISPTPTKPEIEITGDRPKMSQRVRGVAYFAREYIKIAGEQELHEGDNLVINDRVYVLRRKKFSNKMVIGVAISLAAILVFALGTMFSSSADTGAGKIIGLALGEDDRPFITGASIRFPELGITYETNGQGFFKSEPLDAGSYKMEFMIDERVLATDYATVVADRITVITMRPDPPELPPAGWSRAPATPAAKAATPSPAPPTKQKKTSPSSSPAASRWAKLALKANVEGAKLTVDGSVIGAGNLTYPRLKPGRHKYTVSKDGYQAAEGTVTLTAGKTRTLRANLVAIPAVEEPPPAPELEHFDAGSAAMSRGEPGAAIAGFTEAIRLNPSYVEAYLERAKAHRQNQSVREAHDDYVRAAELYKLRRAHNLAFSAYEQALALNPKSIPVLLGRGYLYLSRSEEIAAIADFDMVIRFDKRNRDGYLGLGRARYNQGYFKKAIKHFKDARSIDSKEPEIHKLLMLSYFRAGDLKQVKKSYEKFQKYAGDADKQKMQADERFAPILKVVED